MLYIFTHYILDRCPDCVLNWLLAIYWEKNKKIYIIILYICWDLVRPFRQQVWKETVGTAGTRKKFYPFYRNLPRRCTVAFHVFFFYFLIDKKKSNYFVKIKRRKTNLRHPVLSHLNLTNCHMIRNHHILSDDSMSSVFS